MIIFKNYVSRVRICEDVRRRTLLRNVAISYTLILRKGPIGKWAYVQILLALDKLDAQCIILISNCFAHVWLFNIFFSLRKTNIINLKRVQ